jgi:type II secretory pathway component PulK
MKLIRHRRGSVLILVLVLIPVLALGAYAFNHAMRAETAGSQAAALQAQARWLADAGVEYARSVLSNKAIFTQQSALDLNNNPGHFAAQPVADAYGGTPAGMFSLVAADEKKAGSIRYGMASECAKIPLGGGVTLRKEALMAMPKMTDEIADAIIDFFDQDDQPQANGAESSYYGALNPPRQARNGPPICVDELLLVRGVTPALLYGNDANLDGVASKNETDGADSWPNDVGDGALNRGWYHFFSILSVADNTKPDGNAKSNINGDQKTVAASLSQTFGANIAAYYVGYRTKNSNLTSIADLIDSTVEVEAQQLQQAWQQAGLDPQQAAQSLGVTLPQPNQPGQPGGGGRPGGGGGAQQNQQLTLTSPWKAADSGNFYEKALTEFSLSEEKTVQGVIDVQNAPAPVLMCLPDVTQEMADKIVGAAANKTGVLASPAWLVTESLVSVEVMRKIESKVTVAPRTFRIESVGFFERNGPVARVEAVINAGETVPQVLQRRDLTAVGNGYPQGMLRDSGVTP